MNPLVGSSLAHAKASRHDFLQGINFEVKQNEEQLIFDGQQMGFATATIPSLACLLVTQMMVDISFPGLLKRVKQRLKFFAVQAGKGAQNARFVFEGIVGEHGAPSGMTGFKFAGDIDSPAYHIYFG
jgi:hypothetical protein